jgi:hypothetical protein
MENKNSPLSGIKIPESKTRKTYTKKKSVNRKIPTPRSYRISYDELDLLKDKTEELSEFAGSHVRITDTLILRALIRLSNTITNEDLYEEIKKIKVEM